MAQFGITRPSDDIACRVLLRMAESLRDFVYIDETSLNSNLSSLGRGVLQEITEEAGNEKQTGGKGSIGAPSLGLGASGDHSRLSTENVTSTLRVLAPYRFNTLESLIEEDEHEISVFRGSEGGRPSRGQTVEITGEIRPMSLFKLESAFTAFTDVLGDGTMETVDGWDDPQSDPEDMSREDMSPEDVEQLQEIRDAVEQFTGSAVPLRMDVNGYPFAIPLEREFMRTPPAEEFLSQREYTVFGRVEQNIDAGDEWDPVSLARILDQYIPQDEFGEEFRSDMRQWGAEMNIPMGQEDLLVSGPGSILSPIAVYW